MDLALLALFVIAVVPLLPTEVALIGMAATVAQSEESVLPVFAVAVAGCLVSDQLVYLAGARGTGLVDRLRRRPSVAGGLHRLAEASARHPRAPLVLIRWLPGGGTVGALVAGALRWPFRHFFVASAIGVTLWCAYISTIGYVGGSLIDEPAVGLLASLAVAVALGTLISLVDRFRQGRRGDLGV
ncbi:DedA family protein [Amycolatopsis lurida]